MNKSGETTPGTVSSIEDRTGSATEASFDERAFVRSARAKSLWRTVALAASVVLVAFLLSAGCWVAWNKSIQAESNRITAYQYELVPLSQPNTFISGSGRTDLRFPGARNTYTAYRPVGSRPVPRGDVTIEFEFWGGEVAPTEGGFMSWQAPSRGFSGAEMAPALQFLYPADDGIVDDADVDAQRFKSAAALTRRQLQAAPASATAELAISFKERKTLRDLEAMLSKRVTLNWGAVDVWAPGRRPVVTTDGSMVGIAFVGPDGAVAPIPRARLEKDLVDDLRFVAGLAPKGTADRCTASADFITANGVKYYGAVVTGPVAELRVLAEDQAVSGAILGFVVEPWE